MTFGKSVERFILLASLTAALPLSVTAHARSGTDYLPPWNQPPQDGKYFTIPEIDIVADLHGDITDPQLVVFFAGNQFMVVHDLVQAFKQAHPEYKRIFVETLPPGILVQQIEQGALVMGNMRITLQPDVYTAGAKRINELQDQHHWFEQTEDYARNRLAIMVYKGNPKRVRGLKDLGRADVRVSMPNPKWEGIARAIETSFRKAGGDALDHQIMSVKVKAGSTYLTQIHHRQTPLRILRRQSDAGPVWYTEAYFQQHILHNPAELVEIPADQNLNVTYAAGSMKAAPHPEAAKAFMNFLLSPEGQSVYRRYGFEPPSR